MLPEHSLAPEEPDALLPPLFGGPCDGLIDALAHQPGVLGMSKMFEAGRPSEAEWRHRSRESRTAGRGRRARAAYGMGCRSNISHATSGTLILTALL